ncbi:hypothetical protein OMAG_002628 [Candidatus Omnitrophus magneticus]|uniref:Uncharacterized protein n=1 Tax=Candidatus Omnitrophus magneticus TaxID=1609969 RepID=A0A0F0CJT8_9BACT|nr:hypothetical protein OMAG_002628 [Candidatus Omnitrophus magneticus]
MLSSLSQILIVLSLLPEYKYLPSGLRARVRTKFSCSVNVCLKLYVPVLSSLSQILIVLS